MWEEGQQVYQDKLDTAIGNADPKPALSIILNVKIEQIDSIYESPVPVYPEEWEKIFKLLILKEKGAHYAKEKQNINGIGVDIALLCAS